MNREGRGGTISVTGPRADTGAALHEYIKNLENVKVGWTLGVKPIAVSLVVGRAPPRKYLARIDRRKAQRSTRGGAGEILQVSHFISTINL